MHACVLDVCRAPLATTPVQLCGIGSQLLPSEEDMVASVVGYSDVWGSPWGWVRIPKTTREPNGPTA
jgi:hypothetical protein